MEVPTQIMVHVSVIVAVMLLVSLYYFHMNSLSKAMMKMSIDTIAGEIKTAVFKAVSDAILSEGTSSSSFFISSTISLKINGYSLKLRVMGREETYTLPKKLLNYDLRYQGGGTGSNVLIIARVVKDYNEVVVEITAG